jgi:membrane protein implicated in regulation of membrane protease activity
MEAQFWTLWWVWAAAALVLGILEILAPGFVFLGFAIGAAGAAALLFFGAGGIGLPPLLFIFAVLSLVAWLVMKRLFALPRGQVKTFDHDIND